MSCNYSVVVVHNYVKHTGNDKSLVPAVLNKHIHMFKVYLDTEVGLSCTFLSTTLVVLGTRGAGLGGV